MERIGENDVHFRKKYKKLHSGVLRYADFNKIGNHVIGPRVPTQNLGLKLGYACFFYLIIYMTKYFNFSQILEYF